MDLFRTFAVSKFKTMEKVTKAQIQNFVKAKLSSDQVWAKRALLRIYEYQTEDEKMAEETELNNGVGFTGVDGKILSSFAKQLKRTGSLSPKQTVLLMKKMPKYWAQIVKISDTERLKSMINN